MQIDVVHLVQQCWLLMKLFTVPYGIISIIPNDTYRNKFLDLQSNNFLYNQLGHNLRPYSDLDHLSSTEEPFPALLEVTLILWSYRLDSV